MQRVNSPLSYQLLNNAEITALTVVAPEETINCFVHEARFKSIKALREDDSLFLIIFCQGDDEFIYFMNGNDRGQGFS